MLLTVCTAVVLRGLLHVQRFLAQDPLVQGAHRRPWIDAQVVGECGLQPLVGVERLGLAFGQVVGGDQLRPQRLTVGMFDRQGFELADDGIATPASDFGFRPRGVRHHLVLGQRGGECVDELEVAQVVQNRSAPFGQGGGQVEAGLFEAPRRGGLHARGLLDDESADVAGGVGDREPIPGGALTNTIRSAPAPPSSLRRFEM